MKCLKLLFILAMLMALVMALSATSGEEDQLSLDDEEDLETSETYNIPSHQSHEPTSLRGTSRFLAQKSHVTAIAMTCDKYPRLCRTKGSTGPDCCKKKCVNVMTDRLNCGMCGKKCKYSELCCKGECVNPMNNKKHCGSCSNKCKKGSSCVYGMCSYA